MHGSHSKYVEITATVSVPITTVKILEQMLSVPVCTSARPCAVHCSPLALPAALPDVWAWTAAPRELSLLLLPSNKLVTESDGFVPEPVYASYTCNFNFILQLNYDRNEWRPMSVKRKGIIVSMKNTLNALEGLDKYKDAKIFAEELSVGEATARIKKKSWTMKDFTFRISANVL